MGNAASAHGPELSPIHYLVLGPHVAPMKGYLQSWGRPLAGLIEVNTYVEFFGQQRLPPGVYIFSDLERLSEPQLELLADVWEQMGEGGGGFRLLNHPGRVLTRFALLRELFNRGLNRFNTYKLSELPERFPTPVFLRHLRQHASFTEPVSEKSQLLEAVATLIMTDVQPEDQAVVEFLDTADSEGIYRKYAAFRVGDRIIPRHLIFGEKWELRYPDLLEPAHIEEEWAYLRGNPHEAELRSVFDIARIDYGRIDYALLDGRPQTWEINTNPIVMLHPEEYAEQHLPAQRFFALLIQEAFEQLATGVAPGEPIPVRLKPSTIRRLMGEAPPESPVAGEAARQR